LVKQPAGFVCKGDREVPQQASPSRLLKVMLIGIAMALAVPVAMGSPTRAIHIGLEFIDTGRNGPPMWPFDLLPQEITDPGLAFSQDGGLVGWDESQCRRAIVIETERIFRQINDTDDVPNIRFHVGPVPEDLPGRRLNLLLGRADVPGLNLLGEAKQNALILEDIYPNDHEVAVVYLDAIARLPLVFERADHVINAVTGTVAHEVGHILTLEHVIAEQAPWPIMTFESLGLPVAARLAKRQFTIDNTDAVLTAVGSGPAADTNLDGQVDAADMGSLFGNWSLSDR
jgi:hypothetical protein